MLIISIFLFTVMSFSARATDPFDTCPSEAFLAQGEPASLYSVDLVSGNYALLSSSMGNSGVINAIGYNVLDNYIYGYDKSSESVVKIGKDYQIQTLSVGNFPAAHFFVGYEGSLERAIPNG